MINYCYNSLSTVFILQLIYICDVLSDVGSDILEAEVVFELFSLHNFLEQVD